MGKILGIDLGITSVGYGIIEENTYKIIDYGVRLFDEGTADNNLTRRTMRGGRRFKARRQNRISAVKHLLVNNNIIDSTNFEILTNVYELRVKGLAQKLSNLELANVLVNIAKRRGSSLEVAVDETNAEDAAAASALTNNTTYLVKNNCYICEYQLNKIKEGKKLRNSDNIFRTEDYIKELKKILSNQGLSEVLNEKIVEIISRRRHFSEGPGSEDFPTPYGSFREECINGEKKIVHVNLIDEMRGKCSVFPNEPRIAKCSYTACLFNLLNDLNNIKLEGNVRLTTEQKNEIIEKYIKPKGKITISQLNKYLQVDENKVSGFRIDKNGKKLITTFDAYAKLIGILPSNVLSNIDAIDDIIEILTKTQVLEERTEAIKNLDLGLTNEILAKIVNLTKINGYHSLSKKAMKLMISEMLETSKNQMQIITDNNLGKSLESTSSRDIQFDTTAILSPVAKRVHMQAIKVINELRKQYKEFSSIVIETTRRKNSEDDRKTEEQRQQQNEENKKKTNELLLDMDKNPDDYNTMAKLKLVLYKQQEGKTIYAGLPIDLDRMLNDPTAYQIEHIIPYAISFDNSLNNKVLASAKENQDKGRNTPWGYFSSGKVAQCHGQINSWNEFEAFVKGLNISSKKKENLLNQSDITKFDNMEEFVARNLNDTSYGIRTVMNTLKKYYKDNNIDTKVFTVRGKLTSEFRSRVGLTKNRDEYIHHAIDALIIAGSKNQKVFNNAYILETNDDVTMVAKTGELFDFNDDPFNDSRFLNYVSGLKNINGEPKDFSYKVDRKTNRSFADQTIYSTRKYDDEEYVIKKYKDIYGAEGKKLKKLFDDGVAQNKLLMARNDEQTFSLFVKIYERYRENDNPFAAYNKEFGPIRKYAKDGKGPIISQVKYIDSKLGNHLDISSKYKVANNKKVVLLQNSPYRTDIYLSADGGYKMLTIRRYHIRQKNYINYIEQSIYETLKSNKKITKEDKFLFSLNRNDTINLVQKNDVDENLGIEKTDRYYKFIATNNDTSNKIEVKLIEKKTPKQTTLTIGKNILKFEKYNVSPAGKWSKVVKEALKLEWK